MLAADPTDPGNCCASHPAAVTAEFPPPTHSCHRRMALQSLSQPQAGLEAPEAIYSQCAIWRDSKLQMLLYLKSFIFPPGTLDFISSLRCLRTVHPHPVMDDFFSLAKPKYFAKGTFCASELVLVGFFKIWGLLASFPLFVLWVFCGAFNDSSTQTHPGCAGSGEANSVPLVRCPLQPKNLLSNNPADLARKPWITFQGSYRSEGPGWKNLDSSKSSPAFQESSWGPLQTLSRTVWTVTLWLTTNDIWLTFQVGK